MDKLLICILTYNRLEFTKQCIESLLQNTHEHLIEIAVYDNGSTDGTKEYLMEKANKFKHLYLSSKNDGVAKALNFVLENQRKADQHFMKLDNDVVIYDENKFWPLNVMTILDKNKNIGCLAFKPDNLLPKYQTKIIDNTTFEYNPEGTVGCCTTWNKEVLNKLGKFDEIDLYGYEDCLYATRMQVNGFIPLYYDFVKCKHIDPGGDTEYMKWKHKMAKDNYQKYVNKFKGIVS